MSSRIRTIAITAIALIGTGATIGWAGSHGAVARNDCPGVITCPMTGEPVCVDRCPAAPGATGSVAAKTIDPPRACCPSKFSRAYAR